jgi:hypothetical protein
MGRGCWRNHSVQQEASSSSEVCAAYPLVSLSAHAYISDDTQKQLFDYFAAILPTGLRLETNTSLPSVHSSTLYLDSPSPLLNSLNATGSIPLDRLARPILSWIEDITLLTRAQLTDIVAEVGELHVPGAAIALTSTYPDGQWAARVAELVGPIGGWRGARNSTVVISTGARWTADLPVFKGYKDHEIIHAFAHGVRPLPLTRHELTGASVARARRQVPDDAPAHAVLLPADRCAPRALLDVLCARQRIILRECDDYEHDVVACIA